MPDSRHTPSIAHALEPTSGKETTGVIEVRRVTIPHSRFSHRDYLTASYRRIASALLRDAVSSISMGGGGGEVAPCSCHHHYQYRRGICPGPWSALFSTWLMEITAAVLHYNLRVISIAGTMNGIAGCPCMVEVKLHPQQKLHTYTSTQGGTRGHLDTIKIDGLKKLRLVFEIRCCPSTGT